MYLLLLLLFLLLLGAGEIWPRKGRKMLGWKRAGAFACVPRSTSSRTDFCPIYHPKRSTVPIRRVAATLEEDGEATAAACKKCFPTAMRIALLITSHLSLSSRGSPMSVLGFSLWIPGGKQPTSKGVAVTECDSRLRLVFLMREKKYHRVLKTCNL